MTRPEKNRAGLKKIWAEQPLREGAVRPRAGKRPTELDEIEKMTAVCDFFCSGMPTAQVRRAMMEKYGRAGWISREDTFNLLNRAADLGWFSYTPPRHREYSQRLIDEHTWLKEAQVIHTATVRDVAKASARMVFDLLLGYDAQAEVHIGLAGGFTVRRVVKELAKLLCDAGPDDELPGTIVLHSLGAGLDEGNPAADPSTFFAFFEGEPDLRTTVRFVGFRGPPIVRGDQSKMLRELPGVRETFAESKEIDIVVMSGARWADKHSVLSELLEVDGRTLAQLEEAGCVGDLMWRPIGPDGPLDTDTQAFTLLDLADLARMVRQGRHVVLALGPCAICRHPKGLLLKALLECNPALVTHLVTDSRTARECFEMVGD